MILIDTSVLVDYLRSPTDDVLRLFEKNAAAICGLHFLKKRLTLRGQGH